MVQALVGGEHKSRAEAAAAMALRRALAVQGVQRLGRCIDSWVERLKQDTALERKRSRGQGLMQRALRKQLERGSAAVLKEWWRRALYHMCAHGRGMYLGTPSLLDGSSVKSARSCGRAIQCCPRRNAVAPKMAQEGPVLSPGLR